MAAHECVICGAAFALGLCLYDARYCPRDLLEEGAGHPLIGARDKVHVSA